jgi:prepilin-type N-terminal cleavage/methylation domain-containing protein
MNVLRRLRDRRGDESGISLIEMSVALLIFGILSATVLSVTISLMNTGNNSNQRFQNLGDAQPVMDVLTRDVRAATAVTNYGPDSITVVTALGQSGGETTITFTLASNGTLTQTSVQPTALGGSNTSTLQLSTAIVYPTGTATPLFAYTDLSGNAISTSSCSPTCTNSGSTAATFGSVTIDLVDNHNLHIPTSAATLTAQVWLRNAIYDQ